MMRSAVTTFLSLLPLLALCLPVMIACIDIMAISVALSDIMKDTSSSINKTQWILSGYTIGTASFFIVIGRLADIYGRKKILSIGVILFAASSLLSGLSLSINLLIIGRFLQGLASAMMMTTVVSIITHTFPADKRGMAISQWGMFLGIGLAIGPLVGGTLLYMANWRWIFFINIPICALSYYLIQHYIRESKDETNKITVNWFSALFLSIFLLLLTIILAEGENLGWKSGASLFIITTTIISFLLMIIIETRTKQPIIDLALFKYKNFTSAIIIGGVSYFCLYAWLFLFSIFLQNVFNFSPLKTGLILTSYSCAFAINSQFVGKMMRFFGNKITIQYGFFIMAISLFAMSFTQTTTSVYLLILLFIFFGIGVTASNAPSLNAATEFIPSEKTGVASGMIFTVRWLGGTIGVALTALIFKITSGYYYGQMPEGKNVNLLEMSNISYVKAALTSGISISCLVLVSLALIGFILATKNLSKKKAII